MGAGIASQERQREKGVCSDGQAEYRKLYVRALATNTKLAKSGLF